MSRTVLPAENCVFRLDHKYGFNQQFPMTFNDVGLSEDGFEFNGSSSHAQTRLPNANISNGLTAELIFNWDGYNSQPANMLFNCGTGHGQYAGNFELIIDPDNILRFRAFNSTSNGIGFEIQTNQLYFVVVEYHIDGTLILHVNNQKIDGKIIADANSSLNDVIFDVGKSFDSAYYFNGTIKNVSIYNRALTAQEVADRYNQSTFLFLNNTPTPTQQAYLDWQNSRVIGRSR
jgi:hypothetical protein